MHKKNDKIAALLHRKRSEQRKSFAVLLDPDKIDFSSFPDFLRQAAAHHVDFFFVGGSLVTRYALDQLVESLHGLAGDAYLLSGNKAKACELWNTGTVLRDSLANLRYSQNCR